MRPGVPFLHVPRCPGCAGNGFVVENRETIPCRACGGSGIARKADPAPPISWTTGSLTLVGPFPGFERDTLISLFAEKAERRIFERNFDGTSYTAKLSEWKGNVHGRSLCEVVAKLLYAERYESVPLFLEFEIKERSVQERSKFVRAEHGEYGERGEDDHDPADRLGRGGHRTEDDEADRQQEDRDEGHPRTVRPSWKGRKP